MSSSDGIAHRRAPLISIANAGSRLDYLVTLSAEIGAARVRLRYVPDRLVLAPGALTTYAAGFGDIRMSPERLAMTVIDDVSNEVVPRWIEVTIETSGAEHHMVVVADGQPNWSNPALLARLERL
jgi:hypothetical protein